MGADLRRQQTDAVQKGLDMSRIKSKKVPQDPTWKMWQFHFHLEKAELKMGTGDFQAAEHEITTAGPYTSPLFGSAEAIFVG